MKNTNEYRFTDALAFWLKKKDWSYDDLRTASGLKETYISRLATGKVRPRLEMTMRLAEAFGISVLEFLAGGFNGGAKISREQLTQEIAALLRTGKCQK